MKKTLKKILFWTVFPFTILIMLSISNVATFFTVLANAIMAAANLFENWALEHSTSAGTIHLGDGIYTSKEHDVEF